MGKSERRTIEKPAPAAEQSKQQLPVKHDAGTAQVTDARGRSQVVQVELVRETATAIQKAWGGTAKLTPQGYHSAAAMILETHPWIGAANVTLYFDWMGGGPWPNSRYWKAYAARPDSLLATAPRWDAIEPGSERWNTYIGQQMELATAKNGKLIGNIVAAFWCEFERRDLAGTFSGFGICDVDDVPLYHGGRKADGLEPDWQTRGIKTARTRAFRMAAEFAFSGVTGANLLAVAHFQERIAELEQEEYRARLIQSGRRELRDRDPYDDKPPSEEAALEAASDVALRKPSTEPHGDKGPHDLRRLHALAERRSTPWPDPHTALKAMLAEIRKKLTKDGDPDPDAVSLKTVTPEEGARIMTMLEEFEPKDPPVEVDEREISDVDSEQAELGFAS